MPFPELEAYRAVSDAPALYSGSFGMGSRDLQPEGVIAAVPVPRRGGEAVDQHERWPRALGSWLGPSGPSAD